MSENEFSGDQIAEEDQQMGYCPYCKYFGRITGFKWCEHHVGVYDKFQGSVPEDLLLPDSTQVWRFREFLEILGRQKYGHVEDLLQEAPAGINNSLWQAYEGASSLFWLDWVPKRTLEVDVDETLFSTTYVSVFIKRKNVWRERVLKKIDKILSSVERNRNLRQFLPENA